MNMVVKIWRWLSLTLGQARRYRTVRVSELPGSIKKHRLYLVGDDDAYWFAALLCPCGCGSSIQLPLVGRRPRWKVNMHKNGYCSLTPSVWRTTGCKSHFFLVQGKVRWA